MKDGGLFDCACFYRMFLLISFGIRENIDPPSREAVESLYYIQQSWSYDKSKQEAEAAWKLTTIKKNLTCESNFWIDFRTMRS